MVYIVSVLGQDKGYILPYISSQVLIGAHIVPHRKFDRFGGTSSATFPNFRYVAPREICVERNCFDSPIAK